MNTYKYIVYMPYEHDLHFEILKEELKNIGFKSVHDFSSGNYMRTAQDGSAGRFNSMSNHNDPIILPKYNLDLFLALAAMRSKDAEYGVGEILWSNYFKQFVKIYKIDSFNTTYDNYYFEKLKDNKKDCCYKQHFKTYCRKATKEEIINLFKEKNMAKRTVEFKVGDNVEITNQLGASHKVGAKGIVSDIRPNSVDNIEYRKGTSGAVIDVKGLKQWLAFGDFKLLKAAEKEEVLHYEVIKAYPSFDRDIKVGDIIKPIGSKRTFEELAPKFPEFFKPVYAPKEQILKIGAPVKEIKISKDTIIAAGEKVEFKKLDLLVKKMQKVGTLGSWEVIGKSVKIGCSEFTLGELESVISVYNKFNS